MRTTLLLPVVLASACPSALLAKQPVAPAQDVESNKGLSAIQMFDLAEKAKSADDLAAAETIYEALAKDPDIEIRTEARFRLGQMLIAQDRFSEAAILYRAILDEKPDAQRVRLELASLLARLGDVGAAKRELRLAQAGGLPPDVARLIDQFTDALRAGKPYGASVEIALAPDNNINRATRSETLDTIIAPFDLSEDAQAKSGLGLALKGQAYARVGIDSHAQLLVRLSGSADLYRQSQFDDVSIGIQMGPEMRSGKDRLNVSGGFSQRWFGGKRYSEIISATANIQHPVGTKALMTGNFSISTFDNKSNDLQDGTIYAASAGYERAFSSRFGAGLSLGGVRQALNDPGYATTSGALSVFAFRELGRTTLVVSLGYSHLEADVRLFLFPRRRTDERYTASLAATFRQLQYEGFAPILRLEYERNDSSVGLYDYKRIAGSIGITRAF
jgi:outer membrane protein